MRYRGGPAGRAGDYRLYWVAQADLAAARGQDCCRMWF